MKLCSQVLWPPTAEAIPIIFSMPSSLSFVLPSLWLDHPPPCWNSARISLWYCHPYIIHFLGLPWPSTPNWAGGGGGLYCWSLNNRTSLFHDSRNLRPGGWWVPSQGCQGEWVSGHCLPAPGGLLTIFGVPCIVETSARSLPSSSCGILPVCLFGSIFPLHDRTPVIFS